MYTFSLSVQGKGKCKHTSNVQPVHLEIEECSLESCKFLLSCVPQSHVGPYFGRKFRFQIVWRLGQLALVHSGGLSLKSRGTGLGER